MGVLYTMSGGICWGFSGACGQYLFARYGLDSLWLTAVRMMLAGILLIALGFWRNPKEMRDILRARADRLRLFVFSMLGLMLCQYTYLTAIAYSNAGTATVLQYLGPVLILVLSCVMARRRPRPIEAAAIVLAVLGTFLIATGGSFSNLALSPAGLIWGLLSALGLVSYTLLPGKLIARFGTIPAIGYAMLLGGVVLALLGRIWDRPVQLDVAAIWPIGGIVLIGTVLAFTLYLHGVSIIGPVRASMIASVEPVSAMVFSLVWLGSNISPVGLFGAACIVGTVLLIGRGEMAQQTGTETSEQ